MDGLAGKVASTGSRVDTTRDWIENSLKLFCR